MSTSTTTDNQAPLFSAFEWVENQDQRGPYRMLSHIRDLAAGVSLALQIIERSGLSQESGDAPILGTPDALRFTRMSIAAMQIIEDRIDEHFDEMSDRGMERRQAEKRGGQAQ